MTEMDREALQAELAAMPPMSAQDEPPAQDPELLAMALKGMEGADIVHQTVTLAEGFGPVVRVDFRRAPCDRPVRTVMFRGPGGTFQAVSLMAHEADEYDAMREGGPAPPDWRLAG